MKTVKELERERDELSDRILKRKMIEMLLECYIDKAEISIKPPAPTYRECIDKDSEYIIQVYIPLKKDEVNKIMEEI